MSHKRAKGATPQRGVTHQLPGYQVVVPGDARVLAGHLCVVDDKVVAGHAPNVQLRGATSTEGVSAGSHTSRTCCSGLLDVYTRTTVRCGGRLNECPACAPEVTSRRSTGRPPSTQCTWGVKAPRVRAQEPRACTPRRPVRVFKNQCLGAHTGCHSRTLLLRPLLWGLTASD